MAAITTNTREFEFANGRKPRGYGMWAFEVTLYKSGKGYTTEEVWGNGNYGDAKRAAIREAKGRVDHDFVSEIKVLP